MEIPKLIILLCCTCSIFASEYSHTIPVENYETELQVLDTHVDIPEPPVKVVKITKTVAVKIPVPYPVKVIEKVPYPVHVSKPYPVPVPQIVHVPQPAHPPAKQQHHQQHEALDAPHGGFQQHGQQEGSYNVQEDDSHENAPQGHSFEPQEHQSFGGNSDHNLHFGASDDGHSGSFGSSYDAPNNYYGYAGDNGDNGSYETKNRHHVVQQYPFKKLSSSGGSYSGSPYH
ncbi:uncharacterized protein LOC126366815 [Pectinophora gossypiella]|uniref:uncharacterized protein LOC126366815 n=1 Tax=Pectinophora gossypiella TaxID=13191 RepID=UPI00214E9DD5|nr:uncharacterized protein LOC126366815 [Pectinophora gossypiella]